MARNQTHGTVFTGDSYFLGAFCLSIRQLLCSRIMLELSTNHLEEFTGLSRVCDVRCAQR